MKEAILGFGAFVAVIGFGTVVSYSSYLDCVDRAHVGKVVKHKFMPKIEGFVYGVSMIGGCEAEVRFSNGMTALFSPLELEPVSE